jgi:hypothetical protein
MANDWPNFQVAKVVAKQAGSCLAGVTVGWKFGQ